MASLQYLLTVLPSLPELGEKVAADDIYSMVKSEGSSKFDYLIDILSSEDEIAKCGLQYYVLQNKEYEAEISANLPEDFVKVFYSFKEKSEADWMTAIYRAWFDMLVDTGKKTGSKLIVEWAKWEYSLRINFMVDRLKKAGIDSEEAVQIPDFMSFGNDYDNASLVEAYNRTTEPLKAEKALDQARIEFIRNSAISYSFSTDELIAYLLELRIHKRYARLNPEQGRKILKEVTAL